MTDLFGDQEGFVYAPVKERGIYFKQHFFEWPQERVKLERHLQNYDDRDVYVSPVLFSERRISVDTFKGSNYLWTEFDGSLPQEAIEPTMRVSSSLPGHEHWYWKLDHFETNIDVIQDLTRRIAYHYGADLSVWDYQNVLRPPDTWNHKRNKPVVLITENNNTYSLNPFLFIPMPPLGTVVDIQLGDLPAREQILAKYKLKTDTLDLLFKDVTTDRSVMLVRLAYDCVEAGLSNEETYVLLLDRDVAWGKFSKRNDQQKQLERIISHVRHRKALVAEITQEAPEVYRFHDFMRTDIKLKWAIEGLLPVAGSMVVYGSPGIGKSTFSLRLAIDLALGRDFLAWKTITPQRVMFISLEMQHYELKEFFEDMKLPPQEQEALQEQFYIWPIGNAYPFDTPDQQIELLKYIKRHKIELIIIDSHSLAMYGSIKDDDAVKRLNSFLNEDVRKNNKCSYMFIHHPRKQGINQEKQDGNDEAFGSTYIVANAQTVVVLKAKTGTNRIHVRLAKTRLSKGLQDFYIERTSDRGFQVVIDKLDRGEAPSEQKGTTKSLGKLLSLSVPGS